MTDALVVGARAGISGNQQQSMAGMGAAAGLCVPEAAHEVSALLIAGRACRLASADDSRAIIGYEEQPSSPLMPAIERRPQAVRPSPRRSNARSDRR